MRPVTSPSRSRMLAGALLAGQLVLLALFALHFDPGFPEVPQTASLNEGTPHLLDPKRIERVFSATAVTRFAGMTNQPNVFATSFFESPKPRPPSTRKVTLLYQGFFAGTDGRRHAYVKVGDQLKHGPPGSDVVGGFAIAEIGLRELVLTNTATETNVLPFNVAQDVEVPVQ